MKALLHKVFNLSPIIFVCLIIGGFIGYSLHSDPGWDIMDDERACVIYWDDGTVAYKSRIMHLGNLKPGESKTIYLKDLPELKNPAIDRFHKGVQESVQKLIEG